MAEHLNGKQSTSNRANDGVDRVGDRIHPRNFVSEEFEKIENTCDCNDPRIPENLQRLILWPQVDPVKMDGESGDENRQVKINACKRSKTQRDGKEI